MNNAGPQPPTLQTGTNTKLIEPSNRIWNKINLEVIHEIPADSRFFCSAATFICEANELVLCFQSRGQCPEAS